MLANDKKLIQHGTSCLGHGTHTNGLSKRLKPATI
jgi:hypothetical protein